MQNFNNQLWFYPFRLFEKYKIKHNLKLGLGHSYLLVFLFSETVFNNILLYLIQKRDFTSQQNPKPKN